jgi:hypothetical protein
LTFGGLGGLYFSPPPVVSFLGIIISLSLVCLLG